MFLERRFAELVLLHESCFNAHLPNYRIMSLIIGHLLKYSMITPSNKNAIVANVLRDLRFEEVMMGWGAFFLHDLDLEKMKLRAIPVEDSTELIKTFKIPFEHALKEKEPPPLKLSHQRASKDYPWGDIVTHLRLIELITTVPDQFLKVPIHTPSGSLKHPDSSLLFMSFTHQIWLLLSDQFSTCVSIPQSLEDAMDVWTLKSIRKISGNISVFPTYDGLIRQQGKTKPTEIFGNRRKIFFPTPDELDSSPLRPFKNLNVYYLRSYCDILETQSQEQIENLNHDLDLIFSTLQCLPASVCERKKWIIWKTHGGKLEFVTNALYYRVKGISSQKETLVHRRGQLNTLAFQKKVHERV
jgi:hypothetical protein